MTAYEMRISDCSSDVCSSDLAICARYRVYDRYRRWRRSFCRRLGRSRSRLSYHPHSKIGLRPVSRSKIIPCARAPFFHCGRSEEHTSELQSLMRISYDVFSLKKKKHTTHKKN